MKRDVKRYWKMRSAAAGLLAAAGIMMSAVMLGGCASAVKEMDGYSNAAAGYQKAQGVASGNEWDLEKNTKPAEKNTGIAANGLPGDGEIFKEQEEPASSAAQESIEQAEGTQQTEGTQRTITEDTTAEQTDPAVPSVGNTETIEESAEAQPSEEAEKEPLAVNVSMKAPDDAHSGPGYQNVKEELNGIWISYLEWNTLPKEQQAFQAAVNQMFDNCVSLGMNAVFVHVRPDADAMYPSSYFPWSKFASGQQGVNPGYDPLAYMIDAAHSRGLQFHAWINPYRVTGYLNSWEDLAASNPAKMWLTDGDVSNDRWVLLHDGYYYFNPAIPQVRELIMNGVKEVVANYNVDGIHFDDYFYPTLNNADPAKWFDKPEYESSGSSMDITSWRRDNVNQLVRGVYAAVKELKPSVVFGVSPAGYVANLRSDAKLFVDIDTWMSQPGYVDYIMPQLYWGFEAKLSNGNAAPYAFENNLNTWIELKNRGNVKLYLGLAMSRAGTNVADNNETSEWLRSNDILKRQVEVAKSSNQVSGFCFFSYSSFYGAAAQSEVANLLPALKN